ncbi:MAG: hypothetical protein F4X91_03715 [Nitrospinae bacterium]|nr:hypothetical protein [Nitrospinota bacterium]
MNVKRRARAGATEERPLAWPGDPESLAAESVDFEALALVLANTCRRDGRLRRFHSLAAHAVAMSEAIEDLGGDVREAALHALLFEASVAWLGPDAAPTRRPTDKLRRLGSRVDRAVREAAGLKAEPAPEQAELLRFISRMADAAEKRDVPGAGEHPAPVITFPPLDRRIRLLDPARAARLWIERLHYLKGPPGAEGNAETSQADEPGEGNEERPHVTYARTAQEEAAPTGAPAAGGSRDAA